jgi:hypothetical protein
MEDDIVVPVDDQGDLKYNITSKVCQYAALIFEIVNPSHFAEK